MVSAKNGGFGVFFPRCRDCAKFYKCCWCNVVSDAAHVLWSVKNKKAYLTFSCTLIIQCCTVYDNISQFLNLYVYINHTCVKTGATDTDKCLVGEVHLG